MSLSAEDIRKIFREELSTAVTRFEQKQDVFEKQLSELDKRVAGLERSRSMSEPPRKAARVVGARSSSVPPSPAGGSVNSNDTLEFNGWPPTTLRDNIKAWLGEQIKVAGLESQCTIFVLRKYGDRALVRCEDPSHGTRLLAWWRENAPKYAALTGQSKVIYARWRPSKERAYDEFLLRKAFRSLQDQAVPNVEKERSALVVYAGAQPAVRVVQGHLVRGPAWPTTIAFEEFAATIERERL